MAIDDSMLVDAGTRRKIYRHPEDDDKILKVFWEDQMPARRRARLWYGRFKSLRRYDDNELDYLQYRRAMKHAPGPLGCIYTIFGYAETTQGRALVGEYVRNADGGTSVTLRRFLQDHGPSKIFPLVDDLFEELAANHVVTKDPHLENILVRELEGGALRLVIIDGLGDPNFIPFATWSKRLNRKKLMRKKQTLIRKAQLFAEFG
ncbi:MAG: YrbL family protein [Alphaproteobacteria bacterium]|nr:YrbL family protein [Alphaproteobacteria bacterium]